MKRFLIKLSVFLLLLAFILALMELGFRLKPTTFKDKYAGLDKYASEIEILALGHSHANEGFNPRVMKHRGYNMAVGFQNVYFDDYILGHFIDRMDSLKWVVIATSYFHFYNTLPDLKDMCGEDLFNTVKYHLYWQADSVKNDRIPDFDPRYNLEILNNPARAYLSMFGYYLTGKVFSSTAKAEREDFIKYGFGQGQDVTHDEAFLDDNGISYAQSHTPRREGKLELDGSFNYSKYKSIVEKCEAKGVRVAIVLYPCWHTYVENLNKYQLEDTKRMMRELADSHGNCIALDLMSDTRFESGDFHDAIHLNKYGAEKMAKVLEDTLFNSL
ncbi:MAG: hypothetical protein IKW99_01400 [Bacteroidales bacterium]|nr:hypothetical protein [Bacteroidales bacterium]